jgi:predicted nucleic acid-binding protein
MRIFLDANILFSAAKSDGAIRSLLSLLETSGHSLLADEFVVEEARRNLALKAPAHAGDPSGVLQKVDIHPAQHPAPALWADLPLPEKDRPVLAAAIRLRCDVLVTGDRQHFGNLYGRVIRGVRIHSPRSLAESVLKVPRRS